MRTAAEKIRALIADAETTLAKCMIGSVPRTVGRLEALRECLAIVEAGKPTPSDDGWIPWSGGECPVARGTKVALRFRDGTEFVSETPAHVWSWYRQEAAGGDIVAYRIVETAR